MTVSLIFMFTFFSLSVGFLFSITTYFSTMMKTEVNSNGERNKKWLTNVKITIEKRE